MSIPFKKLNYRYYRQYLDRYFGKHPLLSYGKYGFFENFAQEDSFEFWCVNLDSFIVRYAIEDMDFLCTDRCFQDIFDIVVPYRTPQHIVRDNGTDLEITLEQAKEIMSHFQNGYHFGMQDFAEEATALTWINDSEGRLNFLKDMGDELLNLYHYDGETVPEWIQFFGKIQAYLICCAHLFIDIQTAKLYNNTAKSLSFQEKKKENLTLVEIENKRISKNSNSKNIEVKTDSSGKNIPQKVTSTAEQKDLLSVWEAYLSMAPQLKNEKKSLTALQIVEGLFTQSSASRETITLRPGDLDHGIRSINLLLGAARICYEINLKGKGKQEGTLKDYENLIQFLFPQQADSRSIANRMRDQKDSFLEILGRQDTKKYPLVLQMLERYR
ncbi:hypothetical protein [Rhizosphaericola mali]|uniref:Uncharacterized protein n=1 Tax=Rhizosphaericola mali TaxID=2545455 RepID=A0A5P2FY20_9BACT|nr:hypothetical protein [Rhizosphaericola mali]QES88085.1 hypothetical protein E0W69_005195 [Rhizosphaericola mali]